MTSGSNGCTFCGDAWEDRLYAWVGPGTYLCAKCWHEAKRPFPGMQPDDVKIPVNSYGYTGKRNVQSRRGK